MKKDFTDIADIKEFRYKTREFLPLLWPILGTAVLAYIFLRILLPETLTIKHQFTTLEEDKKIIARLSRKLEVLGGYDEDDLVALIARANILLPANDNLAHLMVYLNNIESESGVDFRGFSLDPKGAGGARSKTAASPSIKFSLEFIGEEAQVFAFLGKVGSSDGRIILVDSVDVTFGDEGGLVTGKIVAQALYAPFATELGKVEEEIPTLTERQQELLGRIAQVSLPVEEEGRRVQRQPIERRANPFSF